LAYKHTEEFKKKRSEDMKGNQYALGCKHSEEANTKKSKDRMGDKNSFYGEKHSEATKKIISESCKGRTAWNKDKIGVSKETSENMRKGQARRLEDPEERRKRSKRVKAFFAKMTKEEKLIYLDKWIKGSRGKPSSLEIAICKVLDNLKIKYLTQHRIKVWYADIYIPSRRLIIECNGNYWHSLPERIKRDKKLENHAKENGYKLIWLWEDEIRENPKSALMNGLEIVKEGGDRFENIMA